MADPLVLSCTYSGDLSCRLCHPQRHRTIFQTKVASGPPSVLAASKKSSGPLRLLLYGEAYLTVFSVEDLLANPPSRDVLFRPDASDQSCSPIWHRSAERSQPMGALSAEFGETSDIFLTASESMGIVLRDLRDPSKQQASLLKPLQVDETCWRLTSLLNEPDRCLRYATFSPDFNEVLALMDKGLAVWDRRYTSTPRNTALLPFVRKEDVARSLYVSSERVEDIWPCWIITRQGSIMLTDFECVTNAPATPNKMAAGGKFYQCHPQEASIVTSAMIHPFEPDIFITGSSTGLVNVWDTNAFTEAGAQKEDAEQDLHVEPLTLLGHEKWVWSLDFSRDGQSLISASSDGTVRVWDYLESTELMCLPSQPSRVGYEMQTGILHAVLLD